MQKLYRHVNSYLTNQWIKKKTFKYDLSLVFQKLGKKYDLKFIYHAKSCITISSKLLTATIAYGNSEMSSQHYKIYLKKHRTLQFLY